MPRKRPNFSTPIEYEFYANRNRLILPRRKGEEETLPCPFCGTGHIHGKGGGHRNAHCGTGCKEEVIARDGTILKQEDGYIVKDF